MTSIVITHPEIISFYEANPSIDIVQINLAIIQLVKPILSTSTISTEQIQSSIFEKINTLYSKIESFTGEIHLSMNTTAKEQTEQFKQILLSTTQEHITPLIRENTNTIIDKTKGLINQPISTNLVDNELEKHLSTFQSTINTSLAQTNQTVSNIITANQQRLDQELNEQDHKINQLTTAINTNTINQQQLFSGVSTILRRFEVGSGKGTLSENCTYNILVDMFPCASIDLVSSTKETGDIMVHRNNKPTVLIENKDHTTTNVTSAEVDKFIRDCNIQNCCGIMLAQHKGISRKQNYEIQVNNGNVLLYLHNVNFDAEKIKVAFEIIDQFKTRLDDLAIHEETSLTLDMETVDAIHKDYAVYIGQRNSMLKMVKDFGDKMTTSLNELKLQSIETIVNRHFATSEVQAETICKYCEKCVKKSVAQHYRHCKAKRAFEAKQTEEEKEEPDDEEELPNTDVNSKKNTKK
jgi:hypothetical protein